MPCKFDTDARSKSGKNLGKGLPTGLLRTHFTLRRGSLRRILFCAGNGGRICLRAQLLALLHPVFHDGVVSGVQFGHLRAVSSAIADVRMIKLGETKPQLPDERCRSVDVDAE